MRGNLSGRQDIEYGDAAKAYDVPVGSAETATNYKPVIVARLIQRTRMKNFQVRTRTTINMTQAMRNNLARMGGAGALYAALIADKTTSIYNDCVAACPKGQTLREFVFPLIRQGLTVKDDQISIADGVYIVNPWVGSETPNVPISQTIIDKFASVLSNS